MRFILLPLVLALSACSMTPELVRPELPVPARYAGQLDPSSEASAAEIGWQSIFADPRLQKLIEESLRNNRDLRIATLNVEAARAQYRIQRADQFPGVDLNAGATRERSRAMSAVPTVQQQVNAGIGVNAFEIDLWGRARAMSEAAFARFLATEEGRRAAQVSLVAAVADAYFAERLAVEQQELAKRTLDNWTEQRDLAAQLKLAGQNSAIDVAQAEGQVARAQAEHAARGREASRASNALALLVAAPLEALGLPEAIPMDKQPVRAQLAAGLPSDLLIYRPDIRQAEQSLRAANADIGAARAAFFPRVSLTASLGFASPQLEGLFRGGNKVWSFAPSITTPLFDAGRLKSELRLAELRQSVAVAEYERAIQTAFREVADGLAGSATYAQQIGAQERVVLQEMRRGELAEQRYRAGVDGRLEWLDAQRELFSAQLELLALRREALGNAAGLYKALGGGVFRVDDLSRK